MLFISIFLGSCWWLRVLYTERCLFFFLRSLHPAALVFQVQAMTVTHPKEGAVYWEGPVRVEMELTLTGEE